jgi:spermidine synthase
MPPDRPITWPIAVSLTFLAAGCVLVLEIAAGRLLAPYVGVSLTTYTGIIGAILAGIALGAWLGGRAADRYGAEPLIGPTLILGGWAAIASIPIVSAVGEIGLGDGVVAIVTLATLGFVLPAVLLSAVAPMIVRATLVDLSTTGTVVGRLSAVGTAGAITGTLLTGFVLLGLVPTRPLIIAVGVLLVVVGVAVTWRIGRERRRASGLAAASLVIAAIALLIPSPCDTETTYYCAAIVKDEADPDGRFLVLDGLTHAYVDLASPSTLRFGYVRRFADASAGVMDASDGRFDALHIGGGGFSFPRFLDAAYPASSQTVLELDPAIVSLARSDLAFAPSERVDVVVGDARRSIEDLPDGRFDLVFGDAFGGLAVPWHLTTAEFLGEVERVMRPGAMLVMNLIDGPNLRFVRAEAATLRARFADVAVVSGEATLAGDAGGNVVLVASNTPLDPAAIMSRVETWEEGGPTGIIHGAAALDRFVADAPILTDDYAPVDQLLGR